MAYPAFGAILGDARRPYGRVPVPVVSAGEKSLTLQEQLVIRLGELRRAAWVVADEAHEALDRTYAREIERQMRWARQTTGDQFGTTEDDRAYLDKTRPMTLAPPGWEP